jgi:Protein of unknown function (DUF3467)
VVAVIIAAAFRHTSGTVSRPTGTASSVGLTQMEGDASDRERYLQIDIPPEVRRGVYANTLTIWFSPYEFAFDWGLAERVEPEDPEDPTSPLRMPMLIVSRVRLPTALVFDVLRALNQAMTDYEAIFGEIWRPEAR